MDLSNFERVLEAGQKLHLEGERLQQFIQQAMEREDRMREREEARRREEMEEARRRDELEEARRKEEIEEARRREELVEARRRDEMEEARRRDEIEWEREKEERERARAHELEMKNIDLQAAQLAERGRRGCVTADSVAFPKLPPFVDEKDDIDCYLQRFERFARSLSWPTESWATRLSALLTGRALDVYSRISDDDAEDYDALKDALLIRYGMTENGFRGSSASRSLKRVSVRSSLFRD